jgi:methylenetetrahydrofolate reductase (NADPH)
MNTCPKAMTYGPCGGVRNNNLCEVDSRPCPFLLPGTVTPSPPSSEPVPLELGQPTIVVDVRAPMRWTGDHDLLWRRTAESLQGCVALLGEHVDNPVLHDDSGALAPTRVIEILRDGGMVVIVTITGRDRSIESARSTIRSYRNAGATAVHCVTGDHPASVGIDRPVHFGAEAVTLIAAAVAEGIPSTVAESPASPGQRPERLATKQAAGAALCILNHAGNAADLVEFADRCRAVGVTVPLVAPIPMVADQRAALALAAFPGLKLPTGFLDEIINAADPTAAGLFAAGQLIRAFASSGRFTGVNLSGSAGGIDPWERLETTTLFIAHARSALTATHFVGE